MWDALKALDPQTIKEEVDLVGVAEDLGIRLEADGVTHWSGICPFHDDHNPSFTVFVGHDGILRWGCFPCGISGDVFDLVQRVRECSFSEAVEYVAGLDLDPPDLTTRPQPIDLDAYASDAEKRDAAGAVRSLLHDRGVKVPVEWAITAFRLGVTEDLAVTIPHIAADGTVVAVKIRTFVDGEWAKKNVRGSRMAALYGTHRDTGSSTVVLVEGESDTWTLSWLLRDEKIDVLGLPAGVTAEPRQEWLGTLRDRDVVLLFDADAAGRAGLRKWVDALADIARSVSVAKLPEGQDVTSADPARVMRALHGCERVSFLSIPLVATNGGYVRMRGEDKEPVPVSDWTLDVVAIYEMDEGGVVLDVQLPDRRVEQIESGDFNNVARLTKWANARRLAWTGSNQDVQHLYRRLLFDAIFVPERSGTYVAGFHDGGYVLPNCSVGAESLHYVTPPWDVQLSRRLAIEPGPWDRRVPAALSSLHRSSVVHPILGWIVASTLRAVLPNFPILAVVGGAGWGKTTLVQECLSTFGFSAMSPMTLTSSTPHAVSALLASTNSIPVWIDEYRTGARKDSKERLDQKIRDAWDGSSSYKGGMQRDNYQALDAEPARAPLVVTGEDAFSETSHAERMVIVSLPKDGRNVDALAALRSMDRAGFGYAFLSWVVGAWRSGEIHEYPVAFDRMTLSRKIAQWGWEIFDAFTRETCGYGLDEFDASLIEAQHAQASESNPIIEALRELTGAFGPDGKPVAWLEGNDVLVRVQAFTYLAQTRTDYALPGSWKAVGEFLRETYQHVERRTREHGRHLRLIGAAAGLFE